MVVGQIYLIKEYVNRDRKKETLDPQQLINTFL